MRLFTLEHFNFGESLVIFIFLQVYPISSGLS